MLSASVNCARPCSSRFLSVGSACDKKIETRRASFSLDFSTLSLIDVVSEDGKVLTRESDLLLHDALCPPLFVPKGRNWLLYGHLIRTRRFAGDGSATIILLGLHRYYSLHLISYRYTHLLE